MLKKYGLKFCYILMLLGFCVPWFTFNAKVTGYRFGFIFLLYFIIPLVFCTLYTFIKKNEFFTILAQLGGVANPIIAIIILGKWQEICNIKGGFDLLGGMDGAQPTYWVTLCLFILYCIVLQIDIINNKKTNAAGD